MSTFAAELEPISPELVLVSSPEDALRARAMLPPPPVSTLDLLAARRREQPATVPAVVREPRSRRRPILVAVSLLLAAGVAFAWVQRPRPLRPYFAQPVAAERPAAAPAAPAVPAVQPIAEAEKHVASAPAPTAGTFVPSRVWVWSADPTATGYLFELAREGSVVLRLHTTEPRLVLPPSFRFRAGTYRWSVRRIPSASAPPLTDSHFTLTSDAAALANR
jgi:hypothetical protein